MANTKDKPGSKVLARNVLEKTAMKLTLFFTLIFYAGTIQAQSAGTVHPCAVNPVYRQFDFWVGEWEAFATNGKKPEIAKLVLYWTAALCWKNGPVPRRAMQAKALTPITWPLANGNSIGSITGRV
jgi:hypothetical protein